MEKTHEELVADFENLQNVYTSTVEKLGSEKNELLQQRNHFESLVLRFQAMKEGLEIHFDQLLDTVRKLRDENNSLSNQNANFRIELENRQGKIEALQIQLAEIREQTRKSFEP